MTLLASECIAGAPRLSGSRLRFSERPSDSRPSILTQAKGRGDARCAHGMWKGADEFPARSAEAAHFGRRMIAKALAVSAICAIAPAGGCEPRPNEEAGPPRIGFAYGGPDQIVSATMIAGAGLEAGPLQIEPRKAEILSVRENALREAAQSFGNKNGYQQRVLEILRVLESRSAQLSAVYDFNRVAAPAPLGTGLVIPPVVVRSFNAQEFDTNGAAATAADEQLEIIAPARLSPVAPTWRDYLLLEAGAVESLPSALLPAGSNEAAKFRQWFDEGWQAGVLQADAEFERRLLRLKRDYEGMLEYRRLVAAGLMRRIVVADADLGDAVEPNSMRIGERSVKIVSQSQFKASSGGIVPSSNSRSYPKPQS